MNLHPRLWLPVVVAALLVVGGCSRQDPMHRVQLLTMGTLVNINVWDKNDQRAESAIEAVEQELNRIHRVWHAWHDSDLTRINQALASGQPVTLTEEGRHMLAQAKELSLLSNQLFNPAIGGLIAEWGFHSDDLPRERPPPDPASIHKWLDKHPNMNNLVLDGNTLSSRNPAVQLDLGAYAKGVAVDHAIAILRDHGIQDAIVNAGGDLRAIGQAGNRPWRIGIRHPGAAGVLPAVETHADESVFTSGNYERFYTYNGVRYHHLIDPRTGEPADGTLSVTVIYNEAAVADAAATALFVAGPQLWPTIARNMGIDQVMLIDKDMNIYMTPKMARRVTFEKDMTDKIIITEP